jgi:hypothetical protein
VACGSAYAICSAAVEDARAARSDLQRLSFFAPGDELALANAVSALVQIGARLDGLDEGLIAASLGDHLRQLLRGRAAIRSEGSPEQTARAIRLQERLARDAHERAGHHEEWFRRLVEKRGVVLTALVEGSQEIGRIRETARWMIGSEVAALADTEFALHDAAFALEEVKQASRLVTALAEGVAEIGEGRVA